MKIENLTVSFGTDKILDGVSLDIEDGTTVCILGRSGSGKTTFLNAVAGLIPYGGKIERKRISYAFQESRLLPALSVKKNISVADPSATERTEYLMKKTGIFALEKKRPSTLSGGEKQRVSLCRALVAPYDVLLADEPFSALDDKSKEDCYALWEDELSKIKKSGKIAIFVTHSVKEAVRFADRILVLSAGKTVLDLCGFRSSDYDEIKNKIADALL